MRIQDDEDGMLMLCIVNVKYERFKNMTFGWRDIWLFSNNGTAELGGMKEGRKLEMYYTN
jgi:hypothetical protein